MNERSQPAGSPESPPLVYLVDDEPMLLELAEAVLQDEGCRFLRFQDPAEAWRVFSSAPSGPDLLITDYAMPSMTGVDLLFKCKRLRPDLRSILVSGTVDASVLDGLGLAVDHFLAKPYQPSQLVEIVRAVLRRT